MALEQPSAFSKKPLDMSTDKSPNALDGEIITIRRGLAIYKVNASPYYFARIRDSRNKKNIVRSTKETSRIEARKAAEELAQSIFNSGVTSEVPKQFRFQHFAELSLQDAKSDVRRGVRAKSFIKNTNFVLENKNWGLLNAFGDRDIRELETKDLTERRADFLRGQIDLLRFAMQLPARLKSAARPEVL